MRAIGDMTKGVLGRSAKIDDRLVGLAGRQNQLDRTWLIVSFNTKITPFGVIFVYEMELREFIE